MKYREEDHLKCACGTDEFDLSKKDGYHILKCRACRKEMSGCMIKCEPCGRLIWLPETNINDAIELQLRCDECKKGFTIAKDLVIVEKLGPCKEFKSFPGMHY